MLFMINEIEYYLNDNKSFSDIQRIYNNTSLNCISKSTYQRYKNKNLINKTRCLNNDVKIYLLTHNNKIPISILSNLLKII